VAGPEPDSKSYPQTSQNCPVRPVAQRGAGQERGRHRDLRVRQRLVDLLGVQAEGFVGGDHLAGGGLVQGHGPGRDRTPAQAEQDQHGQQDPELARGGAGARGERAQAAWG
jgi:hypothetical protein